MMVSFSEAETGLKVERYVQIKGHDEKVKKVFGFCEMHRTRKEIQLFLDLSIRTYFYDAILKPMLK